MRKRNPAMPLLVEDINGSEVREWRTEEGYRRVLFKTTSGALASRILITGVLVEKEHIGSDGSPLVRMRVADPSGGISFTAGRYQPEVLKTIEKLDTPMFVVVIGRASSFTSRSGNEIVTITPETIKEISRPERDGWLLSAVRDAMARLWTMDGKGGIAPGIDPRQKAEENDVSDPGARAMLKNVLLSMDRSGFSRLLEETRERMEEGSNDNDPAGDYDDKVLDMIRDLDSGDGARWDDVVDYIDRNRLSRDVIEEVVSGLLDKGLIYEPVLGYLKAL